MHTLHTAAIVLALAAFGAAQSLAGLPACAITCVTNSLPSSCNLDPKCICESDTFISGVACCVSTACDKDGQDAALNYAKGICTPVGVTDLPSSATCAAGQGNGTSSTGTAASATGSGSSSGSGSASTTPSASSSGTSGSTSATGSGSSSSGSATGSAAPAASSGAAAASGPALLHVQNVGLGLGVGLLGVAALL